MLKGKYKLIEGHQVQEVSFEGDETKYFEFLDSNNAPCHRMYFAMQYYNELKCRVDREYLLAHNKAIKDCINGASATNKGVVDLVQITKLITQMDERLEWILEPESIYKYASVIIFDEKKNPNTPNTKYNLEVKIPRWKKLGLSSFFLSQPIKRLFPALNLSEEDLDIYMRVQKEVEKVHLESIFTTLSKDNPTKNLLNILESLKQKIQALGK